MYLEKMEHSGTSLVVPWWRTHLPVQGQGSVPCQGTKILHAGHRQTKRNKPEFIHHKKSCQNRNRDTASIFDSGYWLGKADLFKEAFFYGMRQ